MFTSEPSLTQRIERMIADTPVIDAHSQIRCDQPGAPDLAALLDDRQLKAGLIAAGMPEDDFDAGLPPDERVRRSIPHLKRIKNTSAAWCLFRIFRDLYDFDEPDVTEGNYRDLFDKVTRSATDPAWATSVLRDRCNLRAVVTRLGCESQDESRNPDSFYYRLDAQSLICPDAEPSAGGESRKGEYYETLATVLGERPGTTERLGRLIRDWLDRTLTGKVRFTGVTLPIAHRFGPPDEAHAQFVLNQAGDDREVSEAEVAWLSAFVAWSILEWHHENRKTVLIAVDGDDPMAPSFQETWKADMARTFRRFGAARFAPMTTSELLARDVALLAGQMPNAYAPGDWSRGFAPILVERNIAFRLQVAPMTKVGGFLSDASSAEWTYGKLQLARKAMARALAGMVEARSFEEDEIPPLLLQILHETPLELFDLGEK